MTQGFWHGKHGRTEPERGFNSRHMQVKEEKCVGRPVLHSGNPQLHMLSASFAAVLFLTSGWKIMRRSLGLATQISLY